MAKPTKFVDVVVRKNFFAALESSESEDSSDSEDSPVEVPADVGFRKWNRSDETRFAVESTANIFSSPFYKGRRNLQKHWAKPRFVEDTDGWVSIRHGQEKEKEKEKEVEEVRADVIYEERKVQSEEEISATMWAERIKNTLEKAEASRAKPKDTEDFKESLNRLSFFRRPMAV